MAAELLKTYLPEEEEDFSEIDSEIDRTGYGKGDMTEFFKDYLHGQHVHCGREITEDVVQGYSEALRFIPGLTEKQHLYRMKIVETVQFLSFTEEDPSLYDEVQPLVTFDGAAKKTVTFLYSHGIRSLSEVTYDTREEYASYLSRQPIGYADHCLSKLDGIMVAFRAELEKNNPLRTFPIKGGKRKVFLLYEMPTKYSSTFRCAEKDRFLIDLTDGISDTVRLQLVRIMNSFLFDENATRWDLQTNFFTGIHSLSLLCRERQIEDIECLEEEDIAAFDGMLRVPGVKKFRQTYFFLRRVMKMLFLSDEDVNWNATIWFLDRFPFKDYRINESSKREGISFLRVKNLDDRRLLQSYIRYLIGITDKAVGSIFGKNLLIIRFLVFLRDTRHSSIREATAQDFDAYFKSIEELKDRGFNNALVTIDRFYSFLELSGEIPSIPFRKELYLRKEILVHHDRSVDPEVVSVILKNLGLLKENYRMMFLVLYTTGLRINEICQLKGNLLETHGGIHWIRVFQNKMRSEKVIPIPDVLFELLSSYMEKNGIGPDEYVFTSKDGTAARSKTFRRNMNEFLEKIGVEKDVYTFRPHDFRHLIATELHKNGASLQAERDFLGHESEDMTKQYIDFVPREIRDKNQEYFRKDGIFND